jgi:hypothetical protein
MRRFFTVLTATFAVVAFSSMVFAQAATAQTEKPKAAAEKTVKAEKVATPQAEKPVVKADKAVVKTLSASGKVAKFDEATKTLTVGDKDFMLAADAKVMAGAKAATTADLAAGKTVKVTYTVVDGKNMASKVAIAAEAKVAAPKVEKKEAKPAEKK